MRNLKKILVKQKAGQQIFRPRIFNLNIKKDQKDFSRLLNKTQNIRVTDNFENQLFELYSAKTPKQIFSPSFKKNFEIYLKKITVKKPLWAQGRWVYYPWLNCVVHLLSEPDFFLIRTSRNRNLITRQEQINFYKISVGIAGLSLGSSVALILALQGGAKNIRLADMDRLDLSNTNRVLAGMANLGLKKTVITARLIYEINPYARVEIFSEGISSQNLKTFFTRFPKVDVLIDEIDHLATKLKIRKMAKALKVPVLMGADNGENSVIDVERYDLNQEHKYFHNRMGNISEEKLATLNKFGTGALIVKHLGIQNISPRTWESFMEMGKTLVSWPQSGGAALLNGAALAYCVRRIANKQPITSNRGIISLEKILLEKKQYRILDAKRKKTSKQIADFFKNNKLIV